MDNLKDLYQEVILDHNKNPHNYKEIAGASHSANGHNPLCGDSLKVFLLIKDEMVEDISFVGNGCAISKASASMMTSFIKGKKVGEIKNYFDEFHDLTMGINSSTQSNLGKLKVFAGVSEYPARVKCATLAWHTLIAALKQNVVASTE